MNITNNTNVDYWFGPHHLPALGSLTLDDTSDTSLYLLDDAVADSVNTLYQSGMISVTSAAAPFPRPTGEPTLLHGDGSPQGKDYAGQGSLYLRRDNTGGATALFAKTSGVTYNTGWANVTDPWTGLTQAFGLQAAAFPIGMATGGASVNSGQAYATGVWLNAGTSLTGLVVNYVIAATTMNHAYLGIYNSSYTLVAVSADSHSSFGSTLEWIKLPISTVATSAAGYVVPTTGLYYFAVLFYGTSTAGITYVSGTSGQGSQPTVPTTGQWPYFAGTGTNDSTLISPAVPTYTTFAPWIGAY